VPQAADGRIALSVDVTSWLHPEAYPSPNQTKQHKLDNQQVISHYYFRPNRHLQLPCQSLGSSRNPNTEDAVLSGNLQTGNRLPQQVKAC